MERLSSMRVVTILLAVAVLAGCGGKESVASKSAAAFREAEAKGIPVGGGHEHGGHASTATTSTSDTGHSEHGTTTSADAHAGMDHGTAEGVDHSAGVHAAGGALDHAGMAHTADAASQQDAHAQHGTVAASSVGHEGHSAPAASTAQHDQHPPAATSTSMDHSQHASPTPAAAEAHAQHAVAAGTSLPRTAPARTSADIQRLQPAATLQTDPFDAPAEIAVAEANKAAMNIPDGDVRHIVPGRDQENPPTPQPAIFSLPPGTVTPGSQPAAVPPPSPAPVDHSQHGAKP